MAGIQTVDDQKVQQRPSALPEARNAAVATYRDSESGRLIVRIFDKDSGAASSSDDGRRLAARWDSSAAR